METPITRRSFMRGTLALAASSLPSLAFAADYPDHPIHLTVPFAPGGNVDTMARLVSAPMTGFLHTSMVVENRPGAGGSIGANYVVRSKPDGYTLLVCSNGPLTVNPFFQKDLPYDPFKDLLAIGKISEVAHVLAVTKSHPAQTLQDLIKLSKNKPVSVGTSGVGSATHMTLVRLNYATGAGLVHVPYQGGGALTSDLIGGTLPAALTELSTAAPLHKSGNIRILGVASARRSDLVPDVPTMDEQGVHDFTAASYVGLLSPAGTPAADNARIQQALADCLKRADIIQKMKQQGAEIASAQEQTSAGFAAFLRAEYDRSKVAIQQAGIKPR